MPFEKAVKEQVKLRIALIGPSGSGKTYSALRFAKNLGGRVALIDSERNSATLYADIFDFDTNPLAPPYSAEVYMEAIKDAGGYDVLIIDSWSHAWSGEGGILDFVSAVTSASRSKNAYTEGWRKATPLHNRMVDTVLAFPGHVIVTMRVKTDYVMEKDERSGKTAPRKVGLAPIQREGMEYEFDIVADIDPEHTMTITKTRLEALAEPGNVFKKPGRDFTDIVMQWANSGVAVPTSIPVLRAEIQALEREIYIDEQGRPVNADRKAAREKHLGADGGEDVDKLTAYRNFLKVQVAPVKSPDSSAPPAEGAGSDMDVATIKEWIEEHRSQLPPKELEQIEHKLDTGPKESWTPDGLKDEFDKLKGLLV